MNITQRRILTSFLGLLLLISSPLIILYAAGYRYNFSKNRIEKVGLLYVTTNPNDTKILVNGQEKTVGKELVLRSLHSGEYDIELFLDGYHTWRKKLKINKNQSTFITDNILFLDEEEVAFELFTGELTYLIETDSKHFFQNNNFIFSFDKKSEEITELELASNTEVSKLSYQVQTDSLVFFQEGSWFSASLNDNLITLLSTPEKTSAVINLPNNQLAITDEAIFIVQEESPELFLSIPFVQSISEEDSMYWVVATNSLKENSFLYQVFNSNPNPLLITQLPYAQSYLIDENYRGFITLHDQTNSILYLVDTSTTPVSTESLFGVTKWQWSENHSQLLASTEFELTIYHFDNGISQELLLRLSTPITDMAWYETESHVFYVTNNELSIVERDQRDYRNKFKLTQEHKNLQILSADEFSIQFSSTTPKGTAFWKQMLTEE